LPTRCGAVLCALVKEQITLSLVRFFWLGTVGCLSSPRPCASLAHMTQCRFHRWIGLLGMVAMFGAVIELPVAATAAVAMTTLKAPATTVDHQPAKPCKHCPKKLAFDTAGCLVKCFQAFYSPAGKIVLKVSVIASRGPAPAPSQSASGTSFSPPLRPPSA
jgi:hypothetical protein